MVIQVSVPLPGVGYLKVLSTKMSTLSLAGFSPVAGSWLFESHFSCTHFEFDSFVSVPLPGVGYLKDNADKLKSKLPEFQSRCRELVI